MCLTCGARARSVVAREAIRTGMDDRQSKSENGGVGVDESGGTRCVSRWFVRVAQTLRAWVGRVRGGPVGRGQTKVALNPRGDSEDSGQP